MRTFLVGMLIYRSLITNW